MTIRATAAQPRPVVQSSESWLARARERTLTPRQGWLAMLAGCLALAAISLLVLPRNIAYDPWSWLIWGREIIHLNLNTRNGATSVKPLAIFFDSIFALAGSRAEPILWLLVSRAATLLSLALAFRLARRLGGVGAGLVAAIGLAVSDEFLGYLFIAGMSEPMAAAAVLAAVDNHMQSRRRWAYVCLVAAGLLRPEAWPFLIAYSLWLAYLQLTWRRVACVVIAVAVPPSWFIIDWFGARQLFRSAGAATRESQGGPLLSREPGLATFRETWHLMSGPILVLFLLGFGAALLAWIRGGRAKPPGPIVWFGLGAIGWLVLDAVLAQGRFATGAPRYLLPGVALACVVAGVFVSDVARALARLRPNPAGSAVAAVVVCAGFGLAIAPPVFHAARQVRSGVRQGRQSADLADALKRAIALDGGRNGVVGCGVVATKNFQVPLVAWQLRVAVGNVHDVPAPQGTVLQQLGSPRIPANLIGNYRVVGTAGPPDARWTVLTTCPPG